MKLSFRQGLVRFQTDTANTPTFLIFQQTGVTLNVSPDPTILTFASGDSDYLFEEHQTIPNAWVGPFDPVDQWLYWDLDLYTGERTFGITKKEPKYGPLQPPSSDDQHWFNTNKMKMYVFDSTSNSYQHKIRVFAAKLDGGGLIMPNNIGSQVGVNQTIHAGMILFDEDDKPVKKFDRFGRGDFLHTESPLASQFSRLVNFKLENSVRDAKAFEYIPEFYCVTYKGTNQIGLASYLDNTKPCIGIASEDMYIGEVRSFITDGYIKNENWNWSQPSGTKLFVGATGEITTDVPQKFSLQQVATIVSPTTILVDIQHMIKFI